MLPAIELERSLSNFPGITLPEETIQTGDGTTLDMHFHFWSEVTDLVHRSESFAGKTYDLPLDGEMHLLMSVGGTESDTPLATLSCYRRADHLIVAQIQEVRVHDGQDRKNDRRNDKQLSEVHPLESFIRGENRIEWRSMLLAKAEAVARGFHARCLELHSAFHLKWVEGNYPLNIAVKNYDLLVSSLPGWIPYTPDTMSDNFDFVPLDQIQIVELEKLLRRVKNKELRNLEGLGELVELSFLGLPIP